MQRLVNGYVPQRSRIRDRTERQIKILSDIYEKVAKLARYELSPGVIKMVKVFIAMKRKLS